MIDIKFIKASEHKVGKWSGGTTTQLAIDPIDAIYKDEKFMWRISSAKVEIMESVFTKLNEYKRVLMILEGELELNHRDQHSIILNKFECDYFDGAWQTSSFGKVTDYNLMMNKNCVGDIEYVEVNEDHPRLNIEKRIKELKSIHSKEFLIHTETFYCYDGEVLIEYLDKSYLMGKGDFLRMDFRLKKEDGSSKIVKIKSIKECNEISTSSNYSALINAFVSY